MCFPLGDKELRPIPPIWIGLDHQVVGLSHAKPIDPLEPGHFFLGSAFIGKRRKEFQPFFIAEYCPLWGGLQRSPKLLVLAWVDQPALGLVVFVHGDFNEFFDRQIALVTAWPPLPSVSLFPAHMYQGSPCRS